MSRMFKSIDKTWNVFVGCRFDCTYCNARKTALTRLKHLDRYKDGFKPHLVESELKKTFKPGEFIFVSYMGDIAHASQYEFSQILSRIRQFPKTDFLLCSKSPGTFYRFGIDIPDNVILGTTIESNFDYGHSKAPTPEVRWKSLGVLNNPRKFLSIEPIMDFDLFTMLKWIKARKPEIIEVGADNYHNNLPEPPWEKVEKLLTNLRAICPQVIEKAGLERLKESRI